MTRKILPGSFPFLSGTGKTALARATANDANAAFFVINGPDIVSEYLGESEACLKGIFAAARALAPAVRHNTLLSFSLWYWKKVTSPSVCRLSSSTKLTQLPRIEVDLQVKRTTTPLFQRGWSQRFLRSLMPLKVRACAHFFCLDLTHASLQSATNS